MSNIAWKFLSILLQRIDRSVLTTKICNNILPTMQYMKKLHWSTDDKCRACGAREDRYHLLRCGHESRIEWQ